jgi:predicted phosphodiesterase
MLEGDADEIRAKMADMALQELNRFDKLVQPISKKCLGLIEGNHEHAMKVRYNHGVHQAICDKLVVDDLTDCCFLRLCFRRQTNSKGISSKTIKIVAAHGHGGGRTPGAEPNSLMRFAQDKEADIALKGHSHIFCILPPIPVLYIPNSGEMPKESLVKYKRAANWGCWVRSYAAGPSTYDSRALYPVRPLSTLKIVIQPHRAVTENDVPVGSISIEEVVL